MDVPIFIDGQRTGTAVLRRDRAGAVIEARLRDAGRVVRLTLYGGPGEEFYLGVPAPENGELRLARRLPPRELSRLPPEPVYAAEAPQASAPGEETTTARRVLWLGGRAYYF